MKDYYYTNLVKAGHTIQGHLLTTNRGERSKQNCMVLDILFRREKIS